MLHMHVNYTQHKGQKEMIFIERIDGRNKLC